MTTADAPARARPTAVLTLDVEDWDHANYAELEGRQPEITRMVFRRAYHMEENTDRWIEICERHGARSTCFILGEFAQRYPAAIRKLREAGHEIASHGYTHELIYRMSREEFREHLKRAVGILGELTGDAPRGFRAPSWSVDARRTPWFWEELSEHGLKYDSSEFPVRTPLFGSSGAAVRPFRKDGLARVPVSVLGAGPLRLPFSSGAFFRLSPLSLIRFGLRRAAATGKAPMVVLHPRELDPEHPRLPLSGWRERVHYARLETTVPKLSALLNEFRWTGVESYLSEAGI